MRPSRSRDCSFRRSCTTLIPWSLQTPLPCQLRPLLLARQVRRVVLPCHCHPVSDLYRDIPAEPWLRVVPRYPAGNGADPIHCGGGGDCCASTSNCSEDPALSAGHDYSTYGCCASLTLPYAVDALPAELPADLCQPGRVPGSDPDGDPDAGCGPDPAPDLGGEPKAYAIHGPMQASKPLAVPATGTAAPLETTAATIRRPTATCRPPTHAVRIQSGFPPSQIVMAATHTHPGPKSEASRLRVP
jgi:hypothetical protein